ncbi:DGQHR domain-containing protein [Cupriavidus alkaliphilus]|uniref:DGQHR domain-containing protein n=1 Tax=Cupriavidus alkaliphilus TaxID=942866 RepID=A0A7W4VE81_9BURK|nr:DGQHR domain-containing protein [Cupriavidus alkaliphilus]MBB3009992.1 DGQHR domain-containing protein [Cupriavidus alkaliphilus]
MSAKIVRPAALIAQGDLKLYATSLKVSDLLIPKFYSVETLDPEDPTDSGYQRLLNKSRAKKLADYIVAGQKTKDAFLPTSIFLATHCSLPFDPQSNTVEIDIDKIGPFSVVDGQHRVEGLKMAAEKDSAVLDFEVPVNIAVELSKIAQMCHFLLVNTTQKSVDKAVEQRIFARLSEAIDVEDIPSLPRWISKAVGKGDDEKALNYVDYLNNEPESPWFGRIEMANAVDEEGRNTTNQKTFVQAIKKYILVAHNPVLTYEEKQYKIFLNYWIALRNIIQPVDNGVFYKYNGVDLFSRFCAPFFNKVLNEKNFTVATMEKALKRTFDNVEGEYAGVGHSTFWNRGGKASYMNSGAINQLNTELVRALHVSDSEADIEI